MKKIIILLCVLSVFLNCKSDNNCISDMNFKREIDAPGPDLITFLITCNQKEFESHIENHGYVEVIFNGDKSFKSAVFGITKLKDNYYELKVSSPYFSLKNPFREEDIYNLFKESSKMQIGIMLNDKKFVFTKC